MGCGIFEIDVVDYPHLYIYDFGAFDESPEKGKLNYE